MSFLRSQASDNDVLRSSCANSSLTATTTMSLIHICRWNFGWD